MDRFSKVLGHRYCFDKFFLNGSRFCVGLFVGAFFFLFSLAPSKPLSLLKDWKNRKSEVLEYEVLQKVGGHTIKTQSTFVTRLQYLDDKTKKLFSQKRRGTKAVLVATHLFGYEQNEIHHTGMIKLRFSRSQSMSLQEEQIFWMDWREQPWRLWVKQKGQYQLEVRSQREGHKKFQVKESLLVTSEELFYWVRNLDLSKSYRKDIQLMGSFLSVPITPEVMTAEVTVKKELVKVMGREAVHVVIKRLSDGRVYQFWVSPKGMHHVIQARWVDGSFYQLFNVEWRESEFQLF